MDWKKFGREVGQYVIACAVLYGLFFALTRLLGVAVPAENRDPLMLVLGFLIAKGGTVVDYFFGSSKGSADKTDALTKKEG